MNINPVKLMRFLWQMRLLDRLTVPQFLANCSAQYMSLTLAQVALSISHVSPLVLFEPINGLYTGYRFIQAAKGLEKKNRIALLACYLGTSLCTTTTDLSTNIALGLTIAAYTQYMKSVLNKTNNST